MSVREKHLSRAKMALREKENVDNLRQFVRER